MKGINIVARHLKTGSGIKRHIPKADLREVAEIRLGIITVAMNGLARNLNTRLGGFRMLDRRLLGGPYFMIGDRVYAVGRDIEVPLGPLNVMPQNVLASHIVYAVGFYKQPPDDRRSARLPQRFDLEQLSVIKAATVTEFWSDAVVGRLGSLEFKAGAVRKRIPRLQ